MFTRLAAAAALFAASAAPAYAVTFITAPGSAATFAAPAGGTTVDFNGALPTGVTLTGSGFSLVTGDSANVYAEPAFSDGSRYLAVQANGAATLAAAGPGFRSLSLFLGSIDTFNTVEILSVTGAVLGSFTGSQLSALANGNQDLAATNQRVTFSNTPGEASIGGVRFLSGQNALEVDNVAFLSAVPEPATWALMLLGFGAVGYSMRRRGGARISYAV